MTTQTSLTPVDPRTDEEWAQYEMSPEEIRGRDAMFDREMENGVNADEVFANLKG